MKRLNNEQFPKRKKFNSKTWTILATGRTLGLHHLRYFRHLPIDLRSYKNKQLTQTERKYNSQKMKHHSGVLLL